MNTPALYLAITLGAVTPGAWADCHIHAPDDYPSFAGKPLVIPSEGDRANCRRLNLQTFSGRGQCHCYDSLSLRPVAPAESAREATLRTLP